MVIKVGDIWVSAHRQASMDQFIPFEKALRDQGPWRGECYLGYHIARNNDEGLSKHNQHLCLKNIAERFEALKTSMLPAVAGSSPPSKAKGTTDGSKDREDAGHILLGSSESTNVGVKYDAPRHHRCRSHDGEGLP